eukprot:scaffold23145_cov59-Attheya_sp.AAC.2
MTANRTKVVSTDSYDSYDGHSRMTPFRDPLVASFPAKIGLNRTIEYRSEGDHNLQTESNGTSSTRRASLAQQSLRHAQY